MLFLKYPVAEIAEVLERDRSTVYREIKRNENSDGRYLPGVAQCKANSRRLGKSQSPKTGNLELMNLVKEKLKERWSPDEISGRFREIEYPHDESMHISHQSIYRWIYSDAKRAQEIKPFMRIAHKPRRKAYGKPSSRGIIPDRVPIRERPEIVKTRERIGDWEADTMVGKGHKSFIMTCVDRKSRLLVSGKMIDKQAASLNKALLKSFKEIGKDKVLTITVDNGKEFAGFKELQKKLKADVYFADPYCSWQRGTNENTNGLTRQFFPKKTDFEKVSQKELDKVVELLNNRPRKCLNYRTPAEVFYKSACCT